MRSFFTDHEVQACKNLIELAIVEDLGTIGDVTSQALLASDLQGQANFRSRVTGVVAGLPSLPLIAERFGDIHVEERLHDGEELQPGDSLARISGSLRSILSAERTMLNFIQRLSGVATLTQKYVQAVQGLPVQVLDTRKTLPGWRRLDKYAVRAGGGHNHRMGLYDAILIKDNHLAGMKGDVVRAIEKARTFAASSQLSIEIEVDTLEQLDRVLSTRPNMVLLDNMSLEILREAVQRRNHLSPETLLEASGGVTLSSIRGIAETGIDRISVGALTHSAPALDIGLDYSEV